MRGQGGGLAGTPAGRPAAPTSALATTDAFEVLSGCLHAWAADFLRSLRRHEESASSAQTAPSAAEAVRQLRGAARRIGSALLTYRPLVDAAWADELSGELRRLSGTLAREYRCAARQTRLLAALRRLAVEGVGGDRAAALLERQHSLARSKAHSAALEALVSARFHAVADAVAVLAYEVPPAPDTAGGGVGSGSGAGAGAAAGAGAVLVPLAERARERLVQSVEALPHPARASAGRLGVPPPRFAGGTPGPQGPGGGHDLQSSQDAAWLEVRILLRHHRYAQEVLHAAGAPTTGGIDDGTDDGIDDGDEDGTDDGTDDGDETGDDERVEPAREREGAREGARPDGPDPRLAAASAALDRHRDAVEAAEAAAAAARTPRIAPATAYALGVLHAGQRQEAEAARCEFGRLWRQLVSGDSPGTTEAVVQAS